MDIAYRLTVYAPRIAGSDDETTVLVPAANSTHSEAFQVSTITGVAGYQPYMGIPRGSRGTLQLPDFRVSVGSYNVPLLDKRLGTDNLIRWISAYVGNDTGSIRLLGRKCVIEETVDGGSNWDLFFVGRVSDFSLTDPLHYNITIHDTVEDLNRQIWTGRPSSEVDYVVYNSYLPLGLMDELREIGGNNSKINAVPPLSGEIEITQLPSVPGQRWVQLDADSLNVPANVYSKNIGSRYNNSKADFGRFAIESGRLRARMTMPDVPTSGTFEMDVIELQDLTLKGAQRINAFRVEAISNTNDMFYLDPVHLTDGREVTFHIYETAKNGQGSLYLNNVSVPELIEDICLGKFFTLLRTGSFASASTPATVTIPYDATSLSLLGTSASLPPLINCTFKIAGEEKVNSFLETAICKPFGVAYEISPMLVDGVPQGALRFFRTSMPTSLSGIASITEEDIATGITPTWTPSKPLSSLIGKYYSDMAINIDGATKNGGNFSELEAMQTHVHQNEFHDVSDRDAPPASTTFDFRGLRAIAINSQKDGEIPSIVSGFPALRYMSAKVDEFMAAFSARFSGGPATVRFAARRTDTINNLSVGDFCLLDDVQVIPNQSTHRRAGVRVYQVIHKSPNGLLYDMSLIDVGVNATMTAPVVENPEVAGINTVTWNVGVATASLVNIHVAVTSLNATVPSTADARWIQYSRQHQASGSVTYTISPVPEGNSIWLRARAESPVQTDLRLPSAWVLGAVANVTMSNLDAPTGLNVTNVSSKTATLNWTNTEPAPIEVWVSSPATASLELLTILPPSSSTYPLFGLDLNPSPSHSAAIRYSDRVGGFSPYVSASFIAEGDGFETLLPPPYVTMWISL